jgi:hypothetical protein
MSQQPKDPMIKLKSRFLALFLAMYKQRGALYTQGYFLGWLAHLARFDITVLQRLDRLEDQYGVDSDQNT